MINLTTSSTVGREGVGVDEGAGVGDGVGIGEGIDVAVDIALGSGVVAEGLCPMQAAAIKTMAPKKKRKTDVREQALILEFVML